MRFKGILRGGQSDPLGAWIDSAIESNIIPIMRLARTCTETSMLCGTP